MTRLTAVLAAVLALSPAAALASDVKPWVHDAPPASVAAGGVEVASKHFHGAAPTVAGSVSFDGSASSRPAADRATAPSQAAAAAPCACRGC